MHEEGFDEAAAIFNVGPLDVDDCEDCRKARQRMLLIGTGVGLLAGVSSVALIAVMVRRGKS